MAGRNSFATLLNGMSEEQRQNVERKKAALRAELSLAELRNARQLTQETIGETLQVGQPAIAKLEKRADMYVGNLRRYINAMGGELEIVARFPEGDVKITNFSSIEAESVSGDVPAAAAAEAPAAPEQGSRRTRRRRADDRVPA